MREAEERAKAKAAEAALAAAEEAEEAKRRWKEEVEARKQEKKRKQQQELQQAAAQLKATGMGATTRREVNMGDMPVPLGLADALDGEEGGVVAGASSRFKAMLAVLVVAVLVVASALAGAVIASVRLQHQQLQLQQQQQQSQQAVQAQAPVAVTPAADDAMAAAALACPPAPSAASYAVQGQEAPELETVAAHEAVLAAEATLAAEQAGTTWAEAAMAMVMKVTHRPYTRTPLYYAGGDYYAELAEVMQQERERREKREGEEAGEDPLAEMLADEWAAWVEAAGHEEWDAPRLSLALSSARVVTTTPLRPKKRGAPSVNKGALALKWDKAQAPPSMKFDPEAEAAEMVLERRLARMPRRRPLALRVALAPFKLAAAIIKLPFQVVFGVLKVVTWPIRAIMRA